MGCACGKQAQYVEDLTLENTYSLDFKGVNTRAKVLRTVDGDTIIVGAFLLGRPMAIKCRCMGFNCAELRGKTEQERAAARDAHVFIDNMLLNKIVIVSFHGFDKYGGRYLAEIMFEDGKKLSNTMIEHGHAKSYNGKGKAKW